jgi:hypothetical protein
MEEWIITENMFFSNVLGSDRKSNNPQFVANGRIR